MFINHELRLPVELSLQYYNDNLHRKCFSTHVQNNIELLLIREGGLEVSLNDRVVSLEKGDIIVFNPFDKHYGALPEGMHFGCYYCLTFAPGYFLHSLPFGAAERLNAVIGGSARFVSVIPAGDAQASVLREQFPHMLRLSRQYGILSETRCIARCFTLLCELLGRYYTNDIGSANRNFAFIRRVIDYVAEHYREPLSTASICEVLAYDKSYFCRRFRESFGTTFSDYLCRYRVERAAEQRGKPGLSLTDIAGQAGFTDYAYFSRSFRKYMNVPPRQYFSAGKLQP
ncbi:MAG: helix-turn-helix transcriptional regulator [Clostridia bacterium]|nr:helix-turn-helix transcriptional regulator [Clostridia bacterium]